MNSLHRPSLIATLVFQCVLLVQPADGTPPEGPPPPCTPELQDAYGETPPTSGINFVTLDLDIQSFPDSYEVPGGEVEDIHAKMRLGVEEAAAFWNNACQGQPANDFPALILLREGLDLTGVPPANIFYGRPRDRTPSECADDPEQQCYAFAETRYDIRNQRYRIEIFEMGGPAGNLRPTLVEFDGKIANILAHEFGHIFGLDEGGCGCEGSIMHQLTSTTTGGVVTEEYCEFLHDTHRPRHPLEILAGNPNGIDPSCVLRNYCPQGNPWLQIRNECGWVLRSTTDYRSVTIYLPIIGLVEVIDVIGSEEPHYTCAVWHPPVPPDGLTLPPPIQFEFLQGPALTLALPRPDEVVTDLLYLRGWATPWFLGLGDLAVWIDGQLVDSSLVRWGFYSPELCDTGFRPDFCDPNSGIEATIDVSGLTPGEHWVEIAAVDQRLDGPLASYLSRRFIVSETVNHDPVAIDDEDEAVVNLVTLIGLPVDIEVTRNDYDPDGDPIRLTNQGIVRPPSHGTAERIDDHTIRYTPNLDAHQTDTLRYAIRDPDNRQARGDVTLWIYYLIYLP